MESADQLAVDERRVADGLNAHRPDPREAVSLMRVLREKLRISVECRSVDPLMRFLYENLSSGIRSVAEVPIACRSGCSHCCRNSWIQASPPEVFFTVNNLPESQRERARESVQQTCQFTEGLSLPERARKAIPCPLLEDDVCSIYTIRPIACRTAVSADAEVCRRSFLEHSGEGIPVPTAWAPLRQGYRLALEGAMLNARLAPTPIEWTSALKLALNNEGLEAAWLMGEEVFAGIQRVDRASAFQTPLWAGLYAEAFGERPPLTPTQAT